MKKLQAKLNRLAEALTSPVAVILEGRDTAGKSSTCLLYTSDAADE